MKKFATHWEADTSAKAEAARVLPKLLQHYFRQGDRVMKPGTSDKRLHQFRLATKRARYTLELFERLYGTAIQEHLDGLKQIQHVLGQLNDCQATLELLQEETDADCKKAWIEAIEVRRDKKRGEFAELWGTKFDDERLREAWIQAVGR